MSADNPFLNPPPNKDASAPASSLTEVINAVSAMLTEQRRFDRETVTKFSKLFGDKGLKWWIVAAGVGGVCELARIIWDGGAFLWMHLH